MNAEEEIIDQTIALLEGMKNRKSAISQLGAALVKIGHNPMTEEMIYIKNCISNAIYLLNGDRA